MMSILLIHVPSRLLCPHTCPSAHWLTFITKVAHPDRFWLSRLIPLPVNAQPRTSALLMPPPSSHCSTGALSCQPYQHSSASYCLDVTSGSQVRNRHPGFHRF